MLYARYWSSWNIWMRSFEIYGKWSVQASKQASIDTHTCAQCSHASVGLAQARPNKFFILKENFPFKNFPYITCVGCKKRQKWWWTRPAFIGYLYSSIRTLPHKCHLHFLLVSTLWRLNFTSMNTNKGAFFKLLLQNSSQICSVKWNLSLSVNKSGSSGSQERAALDTE